MNRGRPLKFDPDQALRAATDAFWSRGYDGSSLQDLLDATRLSKSSLYQRFGSKPELFERCLSRYVGEMETLLEQARARAPSGRAFIAQVLMQIIAEASPARGCLLFNTANEFGQTDPVIAQRVRQGLQRLRTVFLKALQQDQAAGMLAAESDVDALADYLITAIGGLRTRVRLGDDAGSLQSSVAIVLKSLE